MNFEDRDSAQLALALGISRKTAERRYTISQLEGTSRGSVNAPTNANIRNSAVFKGRADPYIRHAPVYAIEVLRK